MAGITKWNEKFYDANIKLSANDLLYIIRDQLSTEEVVDLVCEILAYDAKAAIAVLKWLREE